MARKRHVLFALDEDERFLLSFDNRQWILERGNPEKSKPGKDTGYRAVTYVPATKAVLMRSLPMSQNDLRPEAAALLDALPDTFFECRELVRALGIDGFREWLRGGTAPPG